MELSARIRLRMIMVAQASVVDVVVWGCVVCGVVVVCF